MKKQPSRLAASLFFAASIVVWPSLVFAAEAAPPAPGTWAASGFILWLALASAAGVVLGAWATWMLLQRYGSKTCEQKPSADNLAIVSPNLNAANALTAGFIHEFNNILCSIQGFADLTLLRAGADGPNRQGLEQIRIGAERVTQLLDQLEHFHMEAATVQPVALGLLLKGYGKCLLAEQGWDQAEQQSPAGLSLQVRDTATLVQAQPLQVQRLLLLLRRAAAAASASNSVEPGKQNGLTLLLRQQLSAEVDTQAPRLELIIEGMTALPEVYREDLEQLAAELGSKLSSRQEQAGSTAYCLTLPAHVQLSPRH